MSPDSVSVFLCDDVEELRMLVRLVLEEDDTLHVVGEAGDGRTGVEEIARLQPGIVVLDLSMPELDGLEAIPLIHEVAPAARILVFSGYESGRMAPAALSRKASTYVQKGASLDELRDAVRQLARAA